MVTKDQVGYHGRISAVVTDEAAAERAVSGDTWIIMKGSDHTMIKEHSHTHFHRDTRSFRSVICFGALALLLLGWSPVILAADGSQSAVNVEYKNNPSTPSDGTMLIETEELWRAGGEDDEIFFGAISTIKTDDEGTVYILDGQLSEISVYTPDGEFLRTLSREGDGPGESRRPSDMFFTSDGTIALVQTFPGKVVKLAKDGTPAGQMNFSVGDPSQGRFSVLVQGLQRGGVCLLVGIRMNFQPDGTSGQTYFLSRCDDEGVEQHQYYSKENSINYADFVLSEEEMDFVWGRFDLDSQGNLFVAPHRNQYLIEVFDPQGDKIRVIDREYESRIRDETDTEVARNVMEGIGKNYPARPRDIELLDTAADISWLRVLPNGTLWVSTSHGEREKPEGAMSTLDVFDPEGNFVYQASLMIQGDPRKDALYMLDDHRVIMVKGALDAYLSGQGVASGDEEMELSDEAALEIICYEMQGIPAW